MRIGPPSSLLSGAASWTPRMSAWLGGRMLAESVPVTSGKLTADASQQVPERLTFTVPRWDGRDWHPGADPAAPLARYGQYVVVSIAVTSPMSGGEHETQLGRFKIQSWRYESATGAIKVEAVGMLQTAADDRLATTMSPTGTLASEARRLLPAGMSAAISPALADRPCPRSMQWDEDRLAALYEIADAWPAQMRTDQWGQIVFSPPLPPVPSPLLSLTDGEGGTVVGTAREDTRDKAYNRVVVRSSATDSVNKDAIQAVVDQVTGPMSVTGDYGIVTKFWSSPLVTTESQARASGVTMLANSLRPSTTIPVTLAPDPRLELDDPVEIICDGSRDWGYVTGYDLPLTVADGAMRIDVGVSA